MVVQDMKKVLDHESMMKFAGVFACAGPGYMNVDPMTPGYHRDPSFAADLSIFDSSYVSASGCESECVSE